MWTCLSIPIIRLEGKIVEMGNISSFCCKVLYNGYLFPRTEFFSLIKEYLAAGLSRSRQ